MTSIFLALLLLGTQTTNLYYIRCYNFRDRLGNTTVNYQSQTYSGQTQSVVAYSYDIDRYNVNYKPSDNTFTVANSTETYNIPGAICGYKSDLWFHFMEVVYGGSSNFSPLLNDIKLYLQYIYGNTDLMLDYLGDDYIILYNINQAVQYIKDNLSNYDSILQDINDNLDDIETEMENINTYLNDTTFTPSTITNNIPNNSNIVSPTDTIVTTFFNNLQDVFTSDEAVDIVLPIPFVSRFTVYYYIF